MKRTFTMLLLGLLTLTLGCDGDESGIPGGEDCRRAANACAPGYRCLPTGGGAFDCVPGRDAMVVEMDALRPPVRDAEVEDGAVSSDSAPMMTSDQGGSMTSDVGTGTFDSGMSGPDLGDDPTRDAGETVDASAEDDMAIAPPRDAALRPDRRIPPPPVDQGPPRPMPDAAVVDPEDMGGGQFGPGRCNHDGMHPREQRDLGGQDQNGARQINPGVYRGLTVGGVDFSDWYRVEVCAGGTLDIEIGFPFDGVDLELDIWHPREARLGQSQGVCTGREAFRWRNDGEIVDIRFNVYPWAPPGRDGNNTYDLTVSVVCP